MAIQSPTGAIGRGVRTTATVVDRLAIGGTLQWTIGASGLGGIADLHLLATLGDGQRMNTAARPHVVIRRGGATLFDGELIGWSGVRSAETATTAIDFDLAPTLLAAGLPNGVTDDTSFDISFRSTILSLYAARQAPPLGRTLGQGDPLRNEARFTGTVAGRLASSDPTVAQLALPVGVLDTTIHAVNGVVGAGTAAAFGDVVTYRLKLALPLGAARRVAIVVAAPGLTTALSFDAGAAIPRSGHAAFTASSLTAVPTVTATTTEDGRPAIRLDFGDIVPAGAQAPRTIDLLLSTTLQPGADLALEAIETESNAFAFESESLATPRGVALLEPALQLQLATLYASNDNATWTGTGGPFGYDPFTAQFGGIISSAGLAGEPFDDRLSGVDAGDEVTFIAAVQNTVRATAHGVVVRATLPAGFAVPEGEDWLTVTNGAGMPLDVSGALFDPAGGLTLATPLAPYDPDSGKNVLLIGYTLRTTDRFATGTVRAGTAEVVSYSSLPGLANRAATAPAAASTEIVGLPARADIYLIGTDLPGTTGAQLALGETATFQVSATLPEGLSRDLVVAAALPTGFEAVSARVVIVGAHLTTQQARPDGAGGIAFGDVLNAPDGIDSEADRLWIEVKARPIQAAPTPRDATLAGSVSIADPGRPRIVSTGPTPAIVTVGAPVAPTLAFAGMAATLANGQVTTVRATLTLPPGLSTSARIIDALPNGLDYVAGSARVLGSNGLASDGSSVLAAPVERITGRTATLDFGRVAAAPAATRQVVVEYQLQATGAAIGTALVNTVTAETGYAASLAAMASTVVVNTTPVLAGLPASQATRDDTVSAPFRSLTLNDPDGGPQTLRITVGTPANGTLGTLGAGRLDNGVYTITGTAAEVTAAARALRFTPTRHQAALGQRIDTDFVLQAQDGNGGVGAPVTTRVSTAMTNTAPTLRNAEPCQALSVGTPSRLFTGLILHDDDAGQIATLTIRLSDPGLGTLGGPGPGRYDPARGVFTSTGTVQALAIEAAQVVLTARTAGAATVTVSINDNAGGLASDTGTIAVTAGRVSSPPDAVADLFIGSGGANVVAVAPAASVRLDGTGARDVFFLDGSLAGPQAGMATGFGGGDAVVLWGFRGGMSDYLWSDDASGRTLHASIEGTSGTRLTFAGLSAADTDRFVIGTGRVAGLDYLAITS